MRHRGVDPSGRGARRAGRPGAGHPRRATGRAVRWTGWEPATFGVLRTGGRGDPGADGGHRRTGGVRVGVPGVPHPNWRPTSRRSP